MPEARSTPEVFIFDLFGVLIDFDNDFFYRRLADHCAEPEEAFRSLEGVMSGQTLQVMTGRQSLAQTHAILQGTHGLKLTLDQFVRLWSQPYSVPMPGMAAVLHSLAKQARLILLSNVDLDYWRSIRPMHPELDLFEALLVSCEVGLTKPDPAIFEQALQVANVAPESCLFIDDSLSNVESARNVGLQGHWFTGLDGLVVELGRFGVTGRPPAGTESL